jgi:branched-chain amino acid transport system substrate-binding protein
MTITKSLGIAAAMIALLAVPAARAGEKSIKIGVLTDLSSFASVSMGPGSVVASQLAAKDFGGTVLGKPIEVISADMQSKPDLAVQLARQWYDVENVDLIVDVPASAAAIAIQGMALEKHKMFMPTVAATTDLTTKACSPLGVHWAIDTAATSRGLVTALAAEGGKNWFLLMPDFAVGKSLAATAEPIIKAGGGKLLDTVYFPTNSNDYANFLLRAQQSGADVIGDGGIGLDLSTSIKQAVEFGILPSSKQRLAAFLMNLSDVDAVGLQTTQGVFVIQDFYWDQNDKTRAFAKEFFAIRNKMPNFTQASNYSGILAYLNAVKEAGTDDPTAVVAKMKSRPQPRFADTATVRADGRVINEVGLYRVKSPAESKYPWDYLKLVRQIPGDQIFDPMTPTSCVFPKKT